MAETSTSFKCPSCGGPLDYKPGMTDIQCEYCDTQFTIQALEAFYAQKEKMAAEAQNARDAKWETQKAGQEWSLEEEQLMRAFTCSSCGAEIVCDENTMATECVYCGNPTMVPARFAGVLKPDYVIPFKKTKEEAVAALKEFYEGKWLLPDEFTKNNRVEAIQGLYVPFWMFDSSVTATATFKAENDMVIDTSNATIIETSVYECIRRGTMAFARIPADGSKRMDDSYMDSIEPFNYEELQPFSSAYLAGYLADKYDVSAEENEPRVDTRMNNSAVAALEKTVVGYMRVAENERAIVKNEGRVEYAMVPVWILTTRYQDKPYTFMMNGQTGKMVGSLPYSSTKALAAFLIVFLVTFAALYFLNISHYMVVLLAMFL